MTGKDKDLAPAIKEDATREINDLRYRYGASQTRDFEDLHDMFGELLVITAMLVSAIPTPSGEPV